MQRDRKVNVHKLSLLSCNRMLAKSSYVPLKDDDNVVAIYDSKGKALFYFFFKLLLFLSL